MYKIFFFLEKGVQAASVVLLASMLTACCLWKKANPRHPIEKIMVPAPKAKEVVKNFDEPVVKPHWVSWAGKGPRLVGEESPEPE